MIEPGSQNFVRCVGKRDGLVVFQPYGPLHETHNLIATNGIVQVQADKPFKLLIANFGKQAAQLHKVQVEAEL